MDKEKLTETVKKAGTAIAEYIREHPEILEEIDGAFNSLRESFRKDADDLRTAVPEPYRAQIGAVLDKTEATLAKIEVKKNAGKSFANELWMLDTCQAEIKQFEAMVAMCRKAHVKRVSWEIAQIAVKLAVVAALAAL